MVKVAQQLRQFGFLSRSGSQQHSTRPCGYCCTSGYVGAREVPVVCGRKVAVTVLGLLPNYSSLSICEVESVNNPLPRLISNRKQAATPSVPHRTITNLTRNYQTPSLISKLDVYSWKFLRPAYDVNKFPRRSPATWRRRQLASDPDKSKTILGVSVLEDRVTREQLWDYWYYWKDYSRGRGHRATDTRNKAKGHRLT